MFLQEIAPLPSFRAAIITVHQRFTLKIGYTQNNLPTFKVMIVAWLFAKALINVHVARLVLEKAQSHCLVRP